MKKRYLLFAILLMTLASFAQPANDDCANAQVLTISNTITTVPFDINSAVLSNQSLCYVTADYADLWYQFTMPYNGNVDINASSGVNNFVLYDACGGNEIMCLNRHQLIPHLTANTVYTLQLYRTASTASDPLNQSFTIKAFQEPANDTCETAQTISVTTSNNAIQNFEIGGAHINNKVGCTGSTPKSHADVWYDFTMPVDGNVSIDGVFSINNFALYDSCNGTQLGCFINDGVFQNLSSGSNYKLRVFRTSQNAYDTVFNSFNIIIDSPLSVSNESQNAVTIYPNPATETVRISSVLPLEKIEIFDVMGQEIIKEHNTDEINISKFSDGIYFLKLYTPKGFVVKRIIKK